jgi:hypothetical protein
VAPEPQWIVLTPSTDDAAWRQAIGSAVTEAGLVLVEIEHIDSPDRIPRRGEVWLTEDAQIPGRFGHTPHVVFTPRPDTAAEAVGDRLGLLPPHNVRHASTLLARAVDQAVTGTLVVSGTTINELRQQRFSLNDWLAIQAPRAGDVVAVPPSIQAALAMFSEGPPGVGSETTWTQRIFEYDARAARDWPAVGHLDITGRPRILVYGPYLTIPRGTWRAKVRFAVDTDAARRQFRIDWGTPTDFQSISVHPGSSGVYEAEITYAWNECNQAELRLLLMEGAFDGRVEFLGATIILDAAPEPSVS